jgi:hypothetical protein
MAYHSEIYCSTLGNLDPVKAIRAIHFALLQIEAGEKIGFDCLDFDGLKADLATCMRDAGHVGYTPRPAAGGAL